MYMCIPHYMMCIYAIIDRIHISLDPMCISKGVACHAKIVPGENCTARYNFRNQNCTGRYNFGCDKCTGLAKSAPGSEKGQLAI